MHSLTLWSESRAAMEETGLQEAWFVTEWENETVELPCGTVHVVPAADHLAQACPLGGGLTSPGAFGIRAA